MRSPMSPKEVLASPANQPLVEDYASHRTRERLESFTLRAHPRRNEPPWERKLPSNMYAAENSLEQLLQRLAVTRSARTPLFRSF